MGQGEKDLLECLLRLSNGQPLDSRADCLVERLVRAGLVDDIGGHLALTPAGIRRCQSLQHRESGDAEAALVVSDRQTSAQY